MVNHHSTLAEVRLHIEISVKIEICLLILKLYLVYSYEIRKSYFSNKK